MSQATNPCFVAAAICQGAAPSNRAEDPALTLMQLPYAAGNAPEFRQVFNGLKSSWSF